MKFGEMFLECKDDEYFLKRPGMKRVRTCFDPDDISTITGLDIEYEDLVVRAYSTLDGKGDQRFLFIMCDRKDRNSIDVEAIDGDTRFGGWCWMKNEIEAMGMEFEAGVHFYLEFCQ